MAKLSPTMQAAVDCAKAHRGKLYRHSGGFWGGVLLDRKVYFGTNTACALVKAGVAEWSDWRKNSQGEFPVQLTLKEV